MIYILQAGGLEGYPNWIAIALAALSSLVIGFIWYNPAMFGKVWQKVWQKSTGLTDEDIKGGNMPVIFITSFILAVWACYWMQYWAIRHPVEDHNFFHGFFHSMSTYGKYVVLPLVVICLYERRGLPHILITLGYWLLTFGTMGGILYAMA